MKNLSVIVEADDIKANVLGMWQTTLFRRSQENGGSVAQVVERFAYLPRFFADTSNDFLERSHFSTWWGVIMRRENDYDNPYMHDLYLVHELYHAGTMPYQWDIDWRAFNEKMQRNELEASTFSEIELYFEMPELRQHCGFDSLYADQFLDLMRPIWHLNKDVAVETLRTARRNVMMGGREGTRDLCERWIRRFATQNEHHALIWADDYNEVEAAMSNFQYTAAADRRAAAEDHLSWLEDEMAKDAIDGVPFRQNAELFAPFYWRNKELYGAEVAKAKQPLIRKAQG